ncbi:hypothetical protein [Accumulibacter sp.]|uniref:hypothetical protein n=1 Tax=Accumulibacter sp. TaxID=2053492 RepID=UPI00260F1BC7|nr:hypothetical protein [Accumulibacter sp.]HRD94744.1 hypothetical protein [Accumulibacter sp.]
MTAKLARPRKATPTPKAPPQRPAAAAGKTPRQAENRWQRTIRYGWDKGGSKGGR